MAAWGIWRAGLTAAGCAALAASSAMAQSEAPKPAAQAGPAANAPAKPSAKATPAPKPAASAHTVETITVTGAAPQEVETSIDKKSYTLGKDLQATTGSVGDVLKSLPSVDVDVQGNLSLRGDQNVTILVDGKPSPMFDGQSRADALQQLPADQYERVEVITNPSAALNPEGSGGVINLISKKSRGAGVTGGAYGIVASAGVKRAGANFGYNSPKLAVTGSLSGNYNHNKQQVSILRGGLDPASGQFLNNSDIGSGRNLARGPTARLSVTYTPVEKDQITGGMTYNEVLVQGHPFDRLEVDGLGGAPVSILNRSGERRALGTEASYTAGWKHTFAEGRDLSVDAIYNTSLYRDRRLFASAQVLPVADVPLEQTQDNESDHHAEFRVGYNQPLAGGSLKTGYELKHDDNDLDHSDRMGPTEAMLVVVPTLANHFRMQQTVNAGFATYEHAFGALTLQGGLRIEAFDLRLAQLTSGQRNGQDYVKAYPTLHLGYKLDDDRKLTASYSLRVQRPPAFLLNPLLQVLDPTNVAVGNPDLKPEQTQSYELGYEQRHGQSVYTATLYFRRKIDQINQLETDLGNGVFQFSFANIGANQATGLELSATGKFTSTLSYGASTNLAWNRVQVGNLGPNVASASVSGSSVGGRVNLNWQVRPDDLLQFNAIANAKRYFAQGVNEPNYTVNLGWRHKVNDRVTATVTAQDLLATSRFQRRLDTPTLFERLDILPVSRSVFFRLDYRFGGAGGKAAKDPSFEYENGGAAPGPG